MGCNLRDLMQGHEVELSQLVGRKIGVDAFNWTYQFLTTIRLHDGSPLMDSKGRITSHLSGIFFRTMNLLKEGISVCYVWDGEPPAFKRREIEEREKRKEEALRKLASAKTPEEARLYAMQSIRLTQELVDSAIELLEAMGVPSVKAASEGEAQLAFMVQRGDLYAGASQDWDSLLFGSPTLIRNLNIVGKRKLPKKEQYVEIKPEIIFLDENLKRLGLTREQLITIALLIGTDYNEGVKGVGPKRALELVRKHKDLDKILKVVKWTDEIDAHTLFEWFMHPEVNEKYELKWGELDKEKVIKVLVDEHDFSLERVEKQLEEYEKVKERRKQKSLTSFFR